MAGASELSPEITEVRIKWKQAKQSTKGQDKRSLIYKPCPGAKKELAVVLSLISGIITAPVPMEATEELGEKIRLEATDIMNQMGLDEGTLKLIRKLLKISPISMEYCESGNFNQENCYSQLYNGLKITYSLLSSTQVYNELDLTNLLYDLEEFISSIEEEMKARGFAVPAHTPQELPRGITSFQEKAGVFLILHDLSIAISTFQKGLSSHQ
ncbi:uncharacterized protein ACMZJ9_018343 [Mantella aurantiaca]